MGVNTTDLLSGEPGEILDKQEDGAPDEPDESPDLEEEQEGDEPPPEHPRFKQVYGRMKHLEREQALTLSQLDALRRQNAEILAKLEEKAVASDPEPDFDMEPQEWRQWESRRQARESEKAQQAAVKDRLNLQVDMMRTVADDYDEVVKSIAADIDRDEALRNRIFSSPNPAKAAYQYGKRKAEKGDADLDGASLQPTGAGGKRPKSKTPELTKKEREAARRFNMTDEQWVKERDALEQDRTRNSL